MNFEDRYDQARTRRHFFRDCGIGVGKMALASMLARDGFAAGTNNSMKALHHPAKSDCSRTPQSNARPRSRRVRLNRSGVVPLRVIKQIACKRRI